MMYLFLANYALVCMLFYFFFKQKKEIIDIITKMKNPRHRLKAGDLKSKCDKDAALSLVWPIHILRHVKNDAQSKK